MSRFSSPRTSTPSPTLVSTDPEQLANASCPRCQAPLEIHQPSIQSPHRLLLTCTLCDGWYYLEVDPDSPMATMVYWPEQKCQPDSEAKGQEEETPWYAIVGLS